MNTSKKGSKNRGFFEKFSWRFAAGYDTFELGKGCGQPLSGEPEQPVR
ncbi:hypothetical protein [uncultured Oscillibacter sp.]|nr:hypothetical protein [uncultured Oscillibacter sp.]